MLCLGLSWRKKLQSYKTLDWNGIKGMVLMNHGLFTFSDDAKSSYENMISLVTKAKPFLKKGIFCFKTYH